MSGTPAGLHRAINTPREVLFASLIGTTLSKFGVSRAPFDADEILNTHPPTNRVAA